MAKHIFAFVFLISAFYCTTGEDLPLPSYITPCSKKDPQLDQCVKSTIIDVIPKAMHGIPTHGVPSLDPLILKKPLVVKGNGLDLTFTNAAVKGLGGSKIKNVKFDLKNKDFRLEFITDIVLTADYDMDGHILVLPIRGHGKSTINAYGTHIDISCKLAVKKTDKGEFVKLDSPDYKYDIKQTHFDFENLFDGKKELAEPALKFVNEKSEDIMAEVAPPVIKQIVTEAISSVEELFKRVPVNQLMKE